jgi:outer membrane protein assembly factor BamB
MRFKLILSAVCLLLCLTIASAADWPAFRGPANDGIAADSSAPTDWGPEQHVKWKTPLPRPGNGSPIVVAGRVFVTSAEDQEGKQRTLFCFDAGDGKQLWKQTVELDKVMPTHETNPYCGSTPLSDGRRVVVWHASGGLKCYDLDGKPQWSRDLGEFRHMWGYGTSPILHGKNVVLHTGPGDRVFVTAINIDTGETIWETDEPIEAKGDRNAAGKYQGSWTSPIVVRVGDADQLIVAMNTRVNGYDPQSGQIVWSHSGLRHDGGDLAYSSPIVVGDICVVTGGFRGPAMAFRLGESGDTTETSRLWRQENQPQSIGSGVQVDGYVYRPNAGPSTIDCLDPATGETRWTERAAGNQWASIIKVGDLLYATSQDGTTIVLRPNPEKFEVVATNRLGEACNATPAAADGQLFIRTDQHLWCIK